MVPAPEYGDLTAYDVWIAPKLALPEPVTEEDARMGAQLHSVRRGVGAPQERMNAEPLKEIAGDDIGEQQNRCAVGAHHQAATPAKRNGCFECRGARGDCLIFGPVEVGIDAFVGSGRLLRGGKDANQFAGMRNTQR